MIRRLFMLAAVSCCCFGTFSEAADLPSYVGNPIPHRVKATAKAKPAKAKVAAAKLKKNISKVPLSANAPADNQAGAMRTVEIAPKPDDAESDSDIAWILDPLVANADGNKNEGSASVESVLVVVQPGYVSSPNMVIVLTGHIVKTAQTMVRLDVRVGDVKRSISWKPDNVQAGKFKIELNAPLQEGKLPNSFPVSALAFVTRSSDQGAAMVSLEKITVRLGKVRTAAAQ